MSNKCDRKVEKWDSRKGVKEEEKDCEWRNEGVEERGNRFGRNKEIKRKGKGRGEERRGSREAVEKTETWGPERGRKLGGGKERKEEKEGKVEKRVCWKEENREEEKKKG